jgi:hypothetical protein
MSQPAKRAKSEHKDTIGAHIVFSDDLLIYFSFLDLKSLSVASRVSSGWRQEVIIHFRLFPLLRCPTLPPANHQLWNSTLLNLQEIVVAAKRGNQWITIEQLMVIRKACPQLTRLTLHGHSMRTDALIYLFHRLKLISLTLLDLNFVNARNTQAPSPTTEQPLLDDLCIKRCSLKASSLVSLISSQTQLKHLDLSFTEVTDADVQNLLLAIPTLHTLRLIYCRNITAGSISLASESRLSLLDVSKNDQLEVHQPLRSSLVLKISPRPNA